MAAEHAVIVNANGRVKTVRLIETAATCAAWIGEPTPPTGPTAVRFVRRVRFEEFAAVVWGFIAAASAHRWSECWYSSGIHFGEQMAEPKWKRFEKLIHQIHNQLAREGAEVTGNDKIVGCESKVERQLGVTIRATVAQYKLLIVVECKDEARPIDVSTMGEFASLLRDVKANKGVMISTSGFTSAAIEMARCQGIDTRTYLDTETIDWRTEVSIPVLVKIARVTTWQIRFLGVPGFPFAIPMNVHFPFIDTFADDGTALGPIITLLGKKWNHDKSLHERGKRVVLLAEHVLIDVGNGRSHTRLEALINVEESCFLGQLPVKMTGFRDEQDGSLATNEMTTDFIEPARIARGEVPGWKQIPTDRDIAIKVMMVMGFTDTMPETPEDVKLMPRP